jgi:pyridoxal 5'-phosphate synthase pdxS subunit
LVRDGAGRGEEVRAQREHEQNDEHRHGRRVGVAEPSRIDGTRSASHLARIGRRCWSGAREGARRYTQGVGSEQDPLPRSVVEESKEDTRVERETGTFRVKSGLAEMLKGGVIMDVTNADQAKIAEDAGACAVMALERVPADIRAEGGVARMADATKVEEIMNAVSVPVMAKARIGHFVEAQILQALGVDYVDESEVLTPADEEHHIDKWAFTVPFVCGARNLGEALRRIAEGAAMIRTKGEAGTGNVVEAVRHQRTMLREIGWLQSLRPEQLVAAAKDLGAPVDLVRMVSETGKMPLVNFAAGGLATPADAALMMQLGVDGVFVGSGIFKSEDPAPRARAIVEATTHFQDPDALAKVSRGLGEPMPGLDIKELGEEGLLQTRGW